MTEATRPLAWTVRRELWENRAVYIAPPVVAAVFLFGYLISLFTLPRRMNVGVRVSAGTGSRG